jgi:large subunit ribosomal protein L15
MPLQRRLPKRGFTHLREIEYVIINLERLSGFAGGAVVSPDTLFEQGMIRRKSDRVKILGDGGVAVPLTVRVHKISKSARQKIEAAGGTVEVLA